ncbi:trypsin-like serine protease [Streptomyces sp. WAC05374]|nr:esterase [Streptomyces sp. WAC05374]TDF40698.1 trypsin-like serine protease [Streptomyces sp. WAC05374]TDF49914.1 trypsin-like serine protease [Streptomyces sp. WAC05374]
MSTVLRIRTRPAVLALVLTAAGSSAMLTGAPATAATGADAPAGAQASVARLHIGEGEPARSCSGTLVDGQWVLTAAACFAADPTNPTSVAPGKPALKTTATIGRSSLTGSGGHVAEVVELVPSPSGDLVMARLATPATGMAPIGLAASPAGEGDTLQAVGFGRTKTEWVPRAAHTASMKVGALSDTELTLAGATADDALCKGDTGAPLLREAEGRVELVGVATRSRQGGCVGETETRTDAVATRTDDVGDWVATTVGRSWSQLMTADDFNGDGKADLLTIDAADDHLYAQPGDGKGKFGKRVKVSEGKWSGMRLLAATDFTGDGKADILTTHTNGSLYLYPGNGKNGVTGSSVAGSGWGGIRLLAAADFNGDNKGDLIAAHTNGNLLFYPGNGKNFASGTVTSSGWSNMRLLTAGDFNGDNKADIYAVHNTGALYLYAGKGNGTFHGAKKTGEGWQNMRLVAAADYNGDSKSDLIALHTSGSVHAYPGNGNGGFGTSIVTPGPVHYVDLVRNGTFTTDTDGWWAAERASIAQADGALLATVEADTTSSWEAIVGQSNVVLRKGATYTLTFDAKASAAAQMRAIVQLGEEPYTSTLDQVTDLTTGVKRHTYTFTSTIDTTTGSLNFEIGGNPAKTAITLDNVSLTTAN